MSTKTFSLVLCMATLAAAVLTACGRTAVAPADAPRAVKLETSGRDARAQSRLVAAVRQQQRADLAFENGGHIASVLVDVGDRVQAGQVLARLDQEPVRLRLLQAQANERSAAAQLQERRTQLRQQRAMLADGAVSQATLTSAQVAEEVAESQLRLAESDRALAERAMSKSELRAPFAGSVVARLSQPQADVTAGQAVLQLEGTGRPQVMAALPAGAVKDLTPGSLVHAQRIDAQGAITLRLRSVSSRLDSGASLQAIFDVVDAATPLRSGDSLVLMLEEGGGGLPSVPLSALVAQIPRESGAVFIYQPSTGVVVRRELKLGAIQGDRVQVASGIAAGDQIVIAGAAFLADGQKVLPFSADTHLTSGGDL